MTDVEALVWGFFSLWEKLCKKIKSSMANCSAIEKAKTLTRLTHKRVLHPDLVGFQKHSGWKTTNQELRSPP